MNTDRAILDYQQKCYSDYTKDLIELGLPQSYTYPDGNPIRPLPPLKTSRNGLMVVGAYPSARFEYRRSPDNPRRRRLVPIADNLQPFGYEQYFDGLRTRTLESADGLNEHLLSPLDLEADQCWITDLVKVFLYKKEHVGSCGEIHPNFRVTQLREKFTDLAKKSIPWLQKECNLCKPGLIVTMGEEVAQVILGDFRASADDLLNRDFSHTTQLGNYPVLFLPHPDA